MDPANEMPRLTDLFWLSNALQDGERLLISVERGLIVSSAIETDPFLSQCTAQAQFVARRLGKRRHSHRVCRGILEPADVIAQAASGIQRVQDIGRRGF